MGTAIKNGLYVENFDSKFMLRQEYTIFHPFCYFDVHVCMDLESIILGHIYILRTAGSNRESNLLNKVAEHLLLFVLRS